jgi:replicative superfamily II helicase
MRMFYGLFIGIDRYESPDIKWLSCARRDARALHALFADTFSGSTQLMVDEQATRQNLENAFRALSTCQPDDVVVIAFAGHGTETHELVTYDAKLHDLSNSCVSLQTLTEWFSRIPARNLVCFLDCCFSGGMGARALQIEAVPRSLQSADSLLTQMSGQGRLIITASLATEKAWENQRLRHGLLTYHLLTALQGAPEVMQSGRISVYKLLHYVTQQVESDSIRLGTVQHPTLRGTLDGELIWPVLTPGQTYRAEFPEYNKQRVTTDLQSLNVYGFPASLLETWTKAVPFLNALQVEAINDFGLLNGEHIAVSAPTSSGKTFIGELAAIRGALNRTRALFLFPLKALVNDKLRHFRALYSSYGLRTIRATGDSTTDDIRPLMTGQYDVCLMTYEKCAALLIANPYLLDQVGTVVIDEVQMITDESRGANLEFLITLLLMRRRQGSEPQIIALSAVIGETNGFERWIGGRLLRKTERPVPLDEGMVTPRGDFRCIDSDTGQTKVTSNYFHPEFRKQSSQDIIVPLTRQLVGEGKSVIVFRETKGEARGCARYLSQSLGLGPAQAALNALPSSDPSLASQDLRAALHGGVGFHIADLDAVEREIVEEQFRSGQIKVLSATTTLAMGVNTPAEAVIIAGLTHPGDKPYSVAEYKNIAGRAGRLGYSQRGMSFLVALDYMSEHQMWTHYVQGQPENLTSRFVHRDTDPRTLILRVLATVEHGTTGHKHSGMSADDIVVFLESSFGAFLNRTQSTGWNWNRSSLNNALLQLNTHRMIESDPNGLFKLTDLGRLAGVSGVEVESIIRLVAAFSRCPNAAAITDTTLITACQFTTELDEVYFPINKKSTVKEPNAWFGELRNQRSQPIAYPVLSALEHNLQDNHQATLRAKKAVACLLWISGKPINEIEEILTQFGGRFDGAAGPVRGAATRTHDVLPTAVRIAILLHGAADFEVRLERLMVRLELGISGDVVAFAKALGDKLSRGDYLALHNSGLTDSSKLEAVSDDFLQQLLNSREKAHALRNAAEQNKGEKAAVSVVPQYSA